MIHTRYVIYPHNSIHEAFVLRPEGEGKLVVMDAYRDLVCQTCGKVNKQAALARGIQPEVVIKSKRPMLMSSEGLYLLNETTKEAFSRLVPDEIDYLRIPSCGFYVACARSWVEPEGTNPGYRFTRHRCNECGRPGEVCWSKAPAWLTRVDPFICINMDTTLGAFPLWVVSQNSRGS